MEARFRPDSRWILNPDAHFSVWPTWVGPMRMSGSRSPVLSTAGIVSTTTRYPIEPRYRLKSSGRGISHVLVEKVAEITATNLGRDALDIIGFETALRRKLRVQRAHHVVQSALTACRIGDDQIQRGSDQSSLGVVVRRVVAVDSRGINRPRARQFRRDAEISRRVVILLELLREQVGSRQPTFRKSRATRQRLGVVHCHTFAQPQPGRMLRRSLTQASPALRIKSYKIPGVEEFVRELGQVSVWIGGQIATGHPDCDRICVLESAICSVFQQKIVVRIGRSPQNPDCFCNNLLDGVDELRRVEGRGVWQRPIHNGVGDTINGEAPESQRRPVKQRSIEQRRDVGFEILRRIAIDGYDHRASWHIPDDWYAHT